MTKIIVLVAAAFFFMGTVAVPVKVDVPLAGESSCGTALRAFIDALGSHADPIERAVANECGEHAWHQMSLGGIVLVLGIGVFEAIAAAERALRAVTPVRPTPGG